MTFAVALSGIEAGRAAISVGRPKIRRGAARVLTLRGLGETNPFISTFVDSKEEVLTSINLAGLLPVRSVTDRKSRDKAKIRWLETTFDGPVVRQLTKKTRRVFRRTRRIPQPVFDPMSALFALRSATLRTGTRLRLLVLAGNSLYEVSLRVSGRTRLYTRLGPRDAIRIDGTGRRVFDDGRKPIPGKPIRSLSLWFSADRARVPLRLRGDTKLGPLHARITSRQPARSSLRVRIAALRPPAR